MATSGIFSCNTTDPAATYQWEANTGGGWDNAENVLSDVSDTATRIMAVNSGVVGDTGQVRCQITTSTGGNLQTDEATLTVTQQTYSNEAQAVIDRMTGLTVPQSDAIAAFVDAEVANGNWALTDEMYCFALGATNGVRGWKAINGSLTGGTFTANGLSFGAGEAAYFDTGVDAAAATNYGDTNGTISEHIQEYTYTGSSTSRLMGVDDGTDIRLQVPGSGSPDLTFRVNSKGDAIAVVSQAQIAPSLHTLQLVGGTLTYYLNDVADATTSTGSSAPSGQTIYLGIANNAGAPFSTCRAHVVTSWHIGGVIDITAFKANLDTLHTALGVT